MIDLQSLTTALAIEVWSFSGAWLLVLGASSKPLALRERHLAARSNPSLLPPFPPVPKFVSIRVMGRVPSHKRTQTPSLSKTDAKAFQGLPNLSKVSQAFPSLFQNKKDCLFFMSHLPKPILVERRLRFGCSSSHRKRLPVSCSKPPSSAAFKSEATLSFLSIKSFCESVSIRG